MKILYYFAVIFCSLIIVIMLIMPFGGPYFVLSFFTEGFYEERNLMRILKVSSLSKGVVFLSYTLSYVFFGAILTCISTLFMSKKCTHLKYRIAISCLIITLIITFIPRIIQLFYYLFG